MVRLAFREDGGYWCAYAADVATMKGAILLGSIAARATQFPEVKRAFMDTMTKMFTLMLKDMGVQVEDYDIVSSDVSNDFTEQ